MDLHPIAKQVIPVINPAVRGLCVKPYERHPKGCPNFNKCDRCPPKVRLFGEIYDLSRPVYAVINSFDLARHVERMKSKNPEWSDAQLRCVLYWQGTARKQLKHVTDKVMPLMPADYVATWCPEGMGVDVTATVATIGIALEWPPTNIVRQVALIGAQR